jgi:hypothetical protein
MAQARLNAVAAALADREYLERQFSGAESMCTRLAGEPDVVGRPVTTALLGGDS